MGPLNVNMRFRTICILSFLYFFYYTKLYTDPHVNKDFFLFKFCSKDSLSCSKVGATHVWTKPQHFKKIFKLKVDGQLSSANVKFLLIQGREAKFLIASFLWASIVVHSKSKWVCKGDCYLKIGKNIKTLVCFICMGTQERTLIDINHHYQISMNQHKNWI